MSRSYRHVPGYNDRDPVTKKIFNRRIRRSSAPKYQDIPNGSAYKKLNNSWEICDYGCIYYTLDDAIDFYNDTWSSKSKDEIYADWVSHYFSK